MTKAGLIVLVTTELFPFTSGGIGRLTYNILKTMPPEELNRTVILLTQGKIQEQAFANSFPGVRLLELEGFDFSNCEAGLLWALEKPGEWLSHSVKILMMLQTLAEREHISYVEFPDWSGSGFATTQQKRLTGFLQNATVAVRLHSTEAALVLRESRLLAQQDLLRYDLERVALQDCDLIIAHLSTIAEETRRIFGLDSADWAKRLLVARPPITLNGQDIAKVSATADHNSRIVFSSKFQEVKRPEIFAQGAALFLAENQKFEGKICFSCPRIQGAYGQAILDIVPQKLHDRFDFPNTLSTLQRDALIASGIVVFTSAYESYCLAAYEAAALGAIVVLDESNPAFGKNTPWLDGENCIKFDGSSHGLAAALKRCVSSKLKLKVIDIQNDPHPWQTPQDLIKDKVLRGSSLSVALVIVNQNEGSALPTTVASALSAFPHFSEIIIVDDGSTDAESALVLEGYAKLNSTTMKIVRFPVPSGYATALNAVLKDIKSSAVAILRSGNTLRANYVEDALRCLAKHDDVGLVCSQVRAFVDIDSLADRIGAMQPIIGDAAISGSGTNNYGMFGFVVRSEVARRFKFRPETGYLCDWAFVQSIVRSGIRVVASPAECIGKRIQFERDLGTPIDEYARLKHIVTTDPNTNFLHAPVNQLAVATMRSQAGHGDFNVPRWYFHMLENKYEPEVEFMAEFFGYSRLGRFIRTNKKFNAFMEKLVNWLSKLGPRK